MPKMTINVDTDAKMFEVSLDGNMLSNIQRIEIYKSYEDEGEYYVHLGTSKEENGIEVRTDYCLECECGEEEMAEASKITASKIEGFVATKTENGLYKQIQKWLKNG